MRKNETNISVSSFPYRSSGNKSDESFKGRYRKYALIKLTPII